MTTARREALEARIRALHEVEATLGVAGLRWGGIPYWPLVRRLIAQMGLADGRQSGGAATTRLLARGAAAVLMEPALNARSRSASGPIDILYLTQAALRTRRYRKRWVDAFFSPLVEEGRTRGDVSIHGLEMARGFGYRLPRHEETELGERRAFWLALSRRARRPAPLATDDERLLLAAGAILRAAGAPDDCVDPVRVRGALRTFEGWRSHFADQLEIRRPRLVAVVTYYSMQGLALLHAAHQAGIPTVDLQHGLQGPGHPMYSAWLGEPHEGWSCLPSAFWVWTESEARHLESWSGGRRRVVVGGNLRTLKLRDEQVEVQARLHDLRRRVGVRRTTLLVTLHPEHFGDWNQRVLALIQRGSPTGPFWLVRLHPSALGEVGRYERLLQAAPAEVRLASELPLGDVLGLCDGHVTVTSTVAIDAAILGVPSLVADSAVAFEDLIKSGIVIPIAPGTPLETAVADFADNLGAPRQGVAAGYGTTASAALDLLLSLAAT